MQKRKLTKKILTALAQAWRNGSISLADVCPHCFNRMGSFSHGKCEKCGQFCGCSFNPCSSSDFCSFHGGTE